MVEYTIYPDAIKILENHGIPQRIEEYKKDASEKGIYAGFTGHVTSMDIIGEINYMIDKGFYKKMPKEFAEEHKNVMPRMVRHPEKYRWSIEGDLLSIHKKCELRDARLYSGEIARLILEGDLWDYKKFGFDTPSEHIGTISAYIIDSFENKNYRGGYRWKSSTSFDNEMINAFSSNSHGDFSLSQKEITPRKTFDPFGNKILFRPPFDEDKYTMGARDSVEPSMLVILLKYADQLKLNNDLLANNAQKLLEYAKALPSIGSAFAESFMDKSNRAKEYFAFYPSTNIPKIDAGYIVQNKEISHYYLSGSAEGSCQAFIASNDDLIFSRRNTLRYDGRPVPISLRFTPGDLEHLLKGIVHQCAHGLGRTPKSSLVEMIKYRFSDNFCKE